MLARNIHDFWDNTRLLTKILNARLWYHHLKRCMVFSKWLNAPFSSSSSSLSKVLLIRFFSGNARLNISLWELEKKTFDTKCVVSNKCDNAVSLHWRFNLAYNHCFLECGWTKNIIMNTLDRCLVDYSYGTPRSTKTCCARVCLIQDTKDCSTYVYT